MITYSNLPDGRIYVEQSPKEKTIYLDSWFWVLLSRSPDLRGQFIKAASSRCTIMYSISSFIELARIRDSNQTDGIVEVMDSVDFGFIDHDANDVIKREKEFETAPGSGIFSSRHPAAERDILDYLVRTQYPNSELKMSAIYKELLAARSEQFLEMAMDLTTAMGRILKTLRKSSEAREEAKARRSSRTTTRFSPPYTQDVLNCIFDYLVVTPELKMRRNDWLDVMHLIVPVSYLHVVLTDKRWLHFARSELKIREPNLAVVYGPKEIDSFLGSL